MLWDVQLRNESVMNEKVQIWWCQVALKHLYVWQYFCAYPF